MIKIGRKLKKLMFQKPTFIGRPMLIAQLDMQY